jgi:hypothetical protein
LNLHSKHRVVGAHLVGSLHAPDAAVAMQTAVSVLGGHLHAIPLDAALAGPHRVPLPALPLGPSGSPRSLGYVDAALRAHAVYLRLRDAGDLPPGVRLQLNLPTPYSAAVLSAPVADQVALVPAYADALAADLAEIASRLPADHLLVQWDATAEMGALTGRLPAAAQLVDLDAVLDALCATFMRTPEDVDAGLHVCLVHARPKVSADLAYAVELAGEVAPWADYVYLGTVPDAPCVPDDFAPLRDLDVRRLVLGLVDRRGDQGRTEELIQAAIDGVRRPFTLAAQCPRAATPMRLDGPTPEDLLRLHARYAAPIR